MTRHYTEFTSNSTDNCTSEDLLLDDKIQEV